MIGNTNKEVINKISKKSFKANKSRNLFAIISIVLTTLLFTSVFTIGMSDLKSTEYSKMRVAGTTFHGTFKDLTKQEYGKIKEHKLIKEYTSSVFVAPAENKEFAKRSIEINYGDKECVDACFASPIKGDIPNKENEILVDTFVLDMLGKPHEINQSINLTYKINEKTYNKDFIVSGIYKGDIVTNASRVYISKEFLNTNFKDINQEELKKQNAQWGLIDLDVNFSNSFDIEGKLLKIIKESGYDIESIDIGVNWAYASTSMSGEIGPIIGAISLLGIIGLAGYLIIYNIFYISVVKDTKFYGLLRTIGCTKKQIKKIVLKQALILAIIGIPIGSILGYGVGVVLAPLVISNTTLAFTKVSASPIIFVGASIFSLVTVLISAYKPARIASKTLPIEAVRYSGVNEVSKKKFKKSSNGAKIHKMALCNIFRNKSKAIIVIASLSLSIIVLNTVYTIVSGFDSDKYLKDFIGTDFTIGDTSFYRWRAYEGNLNAVTEDLCKEIESKQGVETVNKMYYRIDENTLEIPLTHSMQANIDKNIDSIDKDNIDSVNRMKESKKISADYYGIDEGIYKILDKFVVEGKFDYEKFKTGNYIISLSNFQLGNIAKVGDKVEIPFKDGKSKEYEVMAVVDYLPLYLYAGYSFPGFSGYLPSEEFKKTTDDHSIMTAMFDVDDKNVEEVENYLEGLDSNNPSFDYRAKSTYMKEFNEMIRSYESVGYGLSFVVGIIGVLNFINVIATSIISRKKELAMLKSIGMTKKQIKKMLILEALDYVLLTMGVILVIGTPITYFGVDLVAGAMSFFSYSFRILPIVLSLPILLIMAVVIPCICFKKINKQSVVEELRENI
jgi:putative ABC transport system permease protein